jgi:tetratricopeptide (TPR) repeat protein/uncharacterized membrane protein YgcG
MKILNRALRYSFLTIVVSGMCLLINVNPLAQTKAQLPPPSGQVSDFAGVLDAKTKGRLESLLENLKQKTQIELYIATVESTGSQDIFDYSRQLALDWNIGARASKTKSLLLVVSTGGKASFTQFSKAVQNDLPEGVLGEMSQRMRTPLGTGQYAEALDVGVMQFVSTLSEKMGCNLQEIVNPVAATAASPQETTALDSPTPMAPVALTTPEKTRPRTVRETSQVNTTIATPTPENASPTPAPVTSSTETATPPTALGTPTPAAVNTVAAAVKTPASTKTVAPATKRPGPPVDDEAEAEEVELTLTLPLLKRVDKLKQFLATHPQSKARPRASELLISAHAGLGDQKLKNGDSAGGVEQLMLAIDEADASISEQLFSGVMSQIPLNLYLRGERDAAFKAAQNIETKFGGDPKRLLALAGFYLGIERGDEAVRLSEQAVKLAPDMSEAHHALALALHISLRLDEAAAEYKKALELDPNSKRARASLADLTRAAGKAEEALALYNEQLKVDPKDKAARTGVVMSLFELGRQEDATAALNSALTEDPRNLALLTGAAYWLAAHATANANGDQALKLARQAVALEPRYTWAQIALAHALMNVKRPSEAERAIRFARQYGKFPTLDYELANVLAAMGLYEEAGDVLRESFLIKDDQIEARLAGRLPARSVSFIELLAAERRASLYQFTAADTADNARILKALLTFSGTLSQAGQGEKLDERAAVVSARDFASGNDHMRAYRELYAASRLIRNSVGLTAALELVEQAKRTLDDALATPAATLAVQADEYRELRATAISAGTTPDVPEAPRNVLTNILRGRIEDLTGWALFNQDKYAEAIVHLKRAATILPEGTPSWRGTLWHLGVALEQSGSNEDALNYYIKSYMAGAPDVGRRMIIERLYRKINGSLNGLDERLGLAASSTPNATNGAGAGDEPPTGKPLATPEATIPAAADTARPTPEKTLTAEASPSERGKTDRASEKKSEIQPAPLNEPTPAPTTSANETRSPESASDASLRAAASRIRSSVKITGEVRDANRAVMANVVVVLISPSGTVLASTTDKDGKYSFTVAVTQRTYRLIPSKDGYAFAPVDKSFAGLSDDQKDIDFVATPNRSP